LFNVDKIVPGNGVTSETSVIDEHVYTQNGVDMTIVDVPGFFDTESRSAKFYGDLLAYIKKSEKNASTKIDVILWVTKFGEVVNEYIQDMITRLTIDVGAHFWKKSIIVLTNSNSIIPPESYYVKADDILNGTVINEHINCNDFFDSHGDLNYRNQCEILAWKLYVIAVQNGWKDKLSKYNDGIDIVMVENNRRANGVFENGVGRLKDGTLIVETFYDTLFKLLENYDATVIPPMFTFLSGNTEQQCYSHDESESYSSSELSDDTDLNDFEMHLYSDKKSKQNTTEPIHIYPTIPNLCTSMESEHDVSIGSGSNASTGSGPNASTSSAPNASTGSESNTSTGSTPNASTSSAPNSSTNSRSNASSSIPNASTNSTPNASTSSTANAFTNSAPNASTSSIPNASTGSIPNASTGSIHIASSSQSNASTNSRSNAPTGSQNSKSILTEWQDALNKSISKLKTKTNRWFGSSKCVIF